jgi:hypothetical protein
VASLTAYAPIFGGTTSTNPVQSGAVGTSGHVLTSNGAGAIATFQAATGGAGSTVQIVNTQTGAVATGTTVIPWDDTIPQNTEGDQYMTLAITPTSATNKLIIVANVVLGWSSATTSKIVALFQDTTASALAAVSDFGGNSGFTDTTTLIHYMTAGTTSSTTFKIRAGSGDAGTTTFNGTTGARKLGGVLASGITIYEVKV